MTYKCVFSVLVFACFIFNSVKAQETAPDIVVTDCEGNEHNLYEKLADGKIVVIGWTMPCATCAGPLLAAHNTVLKYAISNPETVEYWLADDYAETTCQTVKDWSETNGITNATFFSTDALDMLDFGSAGMPKVVVIGCNQANVYCNLNDMFNDRPIDLAIKTAINDLADNCESVSINDIELKQSISLYPNPATTMVTMAVSSNAQIESIDLVNTLGQKVREVNLNGVSLTGETQIDLKGLDIGFYHLIVRATDGVAAMPFQKL